MGPFGCAPHPAIRFAHGHLLPEGEELPANVWLAAIDCATFALSGLRSAGRWSPAKMVVGAVAEKPRDSA